MNAYPRAWITFGIFGKRRFGYIASRELTDCERRRGREREKGLEIMQQMIEKNIVWHAERQETFSAIPPSLARKVRHIFYACQG